MAGVIADSGTTVESRVPGMKISPRNAAATHSYYLVCRTGSRTRQVMRSSSSA